MSPQVLLLLRAENPEHADRAWERMVVWKPTSLPSALDDQVNEALRLTRTGADPAERCSYDAAPIEETKRARTR